MFTFFGRHAHIVFLLCADNFSAMRIQFSRYAQLIILPTVHRKVISPRKSQFM